MTIEEFNVQACCEQAVIMCKKLADVDLDDTPESLEKLEAVIQQTRALRRKDSTLINEDVAWNLSVYFGTYFGEVMRKDQLGARGFFWQMNENNLPVLMTENGKNAISPIAKVFKKLSDLEEEHDSEGDLAGVYKIYLWMLDRNNN